MADRKDFFFRQLVTEAQIDSAFDGVEQADRDIMIDAGIIGIVSGLVIAQHSGTPDLTVDAAAGVAYDQLGQRCAVASLQTIDVSTDSLGVSTAVAAPGNERWVSIFIRFARTLSDPQLDGNNVTIFFNREESFSFERVQGAEAAIGAATRPALGTDKILLADVQRTNGQTQVLTANISMTGTTGRRENAFKFASGPYSVGAGTPEASDAAILAAFYGFVQNLASAAVDGASLVGAAAGSGGLGAGTVRSQLNALGSSVQTLNGLVSGKANLAGGNTLTGVQTVQGKVQLDGSVAGINVRQTSVGDANISLAADRWESVRVIDTLTVDRTLNLEDPATRNSRGHRCTFFRLDADPDYTFYIRRHGGTTLAQLPILVGSWVTFEVSATDVWHAVAWGGGAVISDANNAATTP